MPTGSGVGGRGRVLMSKMRLEMLMPVLYTQTVAIRTVTCDEFGKER